MNKVLVTGTLGYDYIMDFSGRFADRIMADKIHKLSLGFLVETLNKQFGGTAGNIAYSLKLLGTAPKILACGGNDFETYLKFFRKQKIDVSGITRHKDVATGAYFVVTDQDDNQIGSFFIGANKYAIDLSIKKNLKDVQLAVLAPTIPEAMKLYVKECQKLKVPYLYDPAFQIATFTGEELKEGIVGAAILIGNDYEISLIEQKLEITHEELLVMVPILITTLGSKGSIIETRFESIHVKPAKVKNTSDPTGAGDAWRAGFIAGYLSFARRGLAKLNSDELQICGQMGSVAAAYTVEKYGTQTHTFTKKDFCKRYFENFGEKISL